jgi:hypothetical protein
MRTRSFRCSASTRARSRGDLAELLDLADDLAELLDLADVLAGLAQIAAASAELEELLDLAAVLTRPAAAWKSCPGLRGGR